jgi:hypothetical protein
MFFKRLFQPHDQRDLPLEQVSAAAIPPKQSLDGAPEPTFASTLPIFNPIA